ncbi:PREDICTED: SAYSvFN domain-containing protein 1-like [Amphimedon queenslandica]|uniref:SAYSvFN domain-containing protein n=1 Tax=Amphimedon queenslandica TaxID=400682 RepID=A0A1X7UAA9_AMPQE|nr:PREDICTED: SAYSvFN domain-containing protein 1-like [Amphimedon queenslandica]|eukprot:XP_011405610.1 PREDICTED: SAYSvFN domain-containing protein 1-like [Amphimedon queenslandica]
MASSSKENFQSLKERLSAYRQQKQNRKETEKETSEASKTQTEQYLTDPILKTDDDDANTNRPITISRTKKTETNSPIPSPAAPETQQAQTKTSSSSNSWLVVGLKTLLWLLLLGFFIEIEFGVAFFISSLFYWMYSFLRGSKRDPKELSAYSVFNKNCERIDGTLAAEQFDQELRYGPTAVRR